MFYILARCPYYSEGRNDREKTGIKRLLSNGTYAAAFPLHDVRQKENIADKYNRWTGFKPMRYYFCAFSADTGKGPEMRNARVNATTCTRTGPDFSAFIKSSLSTLSGNQTSHCGAVQDLKLSAVLSKRVHPVVAGSTTGRRSGSTLPGWGSTRRCCSLRPSWVSYVLPMDCSVMTTTYQG